MQVWRKYESTAAWVLGCAVLALLGRLLAMEAGWQQSAIWILAGGTLGLAIGLAIKHAWERGDDEG